MPAHSPGAAATHKVRYSDEQTEQVVRMTEVENGELVECPIPRLYADVVTVPSQ